MDIEKFAYITKGYATEIMKRKFKKQLSFNRFCGKPLISLQQANDMIAKNINSDSPFMAARLGGMETSFFPRVNNSCNGVDIPIRNSLDRLCSNAGFFPNDLSCAYRFAKEMQQAISKTDLAGVTGWWMEDYSYKKWGGKNLQYCVMRGLEPFFVERPWTTSLCGKSVLVIHPFEDSIKSQYDKRLQLFKDPRILPEFELHTLKAVQTIAGNRDERFETWFDALDYMFAKAMTIDFDVAIIGCGAYGYPLAAKIKEAGKKAIHLGGVTQILFGIKGRRWTERDDYKVFMNEHWISPSDLETPKNMNTIEGGCYW